jgi:hypothetical protein
MPDAAGAGSNGANGRYGANPSVFDTSAADAYSQKLQADLQAANNATLAAFAEASTYATLGYGEGSVPFGTIASDIAPPPTRRDQFDLGAGQLAGAAAAFGEAGTIAAAGLGEALTGIGVAPAIATELAAVVVAVGAATNALTGVYNMASGDSTGRGGGTGSMGRGRSPEVRRDFGSFNEARADAKLRSGLGPGEGKPFVQEIGPQKGRITGMQSADGARGWRIDFDTRGDKGFHVNWWNGSERGANVVQGADIDQYWETLSHFP